METAGMGGLAGFQYVSPNAMKVNKHYGVGLCTGCPNKHGNQVTTLTITAKFFMNTIVALF